MTDDKKAHAVVCGLAGFFAQYHARYGQYFISDGHYANYYNRDGKPSYARNGETHIPGANPIRQLSPTWVDCDVPTWFTGWRDE
jgi:hypothetical protein